MEQVERQSILLRFYMKLWCRVQRRQPDDDKYQAVENLNTVSTTPEAETESIIATLPEDNRKLKC